MLPSPLPDFAPGTLLHDFAVRSHTSAGSLALDTLRGERLSWREWARASWHCAAALVDAGIKPGDRVAILSANRELWPIADVGVLLAGGTSVGLYPTSAPSQVADVLRDSGARMIFVDDVGQLAKVDAVRAQLPQLVQVVVVDAAAAANDDAITWNGFLAGGAAHLGDPDFEAMLVDRSAQVGPDDAALLIYTSGSTGTPKGAIISHRTLLASAHSVIDTLGLTDLDSSLSFLPYCHAGERMFGQATRIVAGMCTLLVDEPARVWEGARTMHPTLFGAVPRFFEKVVDALQSMMRSTTGADREQWNRAESLGRERSQLRRRGEAVPATLEAEWRAASSIATPVLQKFFGNRLRLATSGGAALPVAAAELLDAFGVTVLGAYGQTEHLCAAMNRPTRYDFRSAGPPMPGTTFRIADDDEILIRRSALTFDGYHGRAQETADAFTDDGAWLLTGDLGDIDADGNLRVTGRKKELIALSTGKKVAPLPIEAALAAEPWIAQAVCVGEGRNYLAAVIALRESAVAEWAASNARPATGVVNDPAVRAAIDAAVARVNAHLSRSEQVKRWTLLPRELSLDHGELTPTLKIRRSEVARLHQASIDALYA